jgi:predicted RND superfamily exporter protein
MSLWSRITEWIIEHARLILVVVAVVTVFLGWWATRVQTDHQPGHFLASDSDVVQNFERLSSLFDPSQDVLYLVFPLADPGDVGFLRMLDSLTNWIESQRGVTSVLSLTNAPFVVRSGDSLSVMSLYDRELPDALLVQRIADQQYLKGLLVSQDGGAPAIIVRIERKFNDSPERIELVKEIQARSREMMGSVALAGFPYVRSMYGERVTREAPLFTFLALAISLVMLFITFRARRAVAMPTIIVALGITWTVGLIALFRHRLNVVTSVLPALLVIIGMANSIHLTTKFYDRYGLLGNRRAAIEDTMRIVGLATFLTSLTTAIGFLVLILSGSSLLAVFGSFAAVGIVILYLLSVTIIPLAFMWLEPPDTAKIRFATHEKFSIFFDAVGRFTQKHATAILVASAGLVAIGIVGAASISSDIFVFSDFYDDDPLRQDLREFEKAYGGVLPLEIVILSDTPGRFKSVSTIRRVERLQQELAGLDGVGQTYSIADLLKLTNQAYFGGHPASYRLPSNYEMPFLQSALRTLAASEDNSGAMSKLPLFADSVFAATRIYLGVSDIGTTHMNALADSALASTRRLFPDNTFEAFATGTAIKATRSGENLIVNLAVSLAVALVLISLIMAAMFRSVSLTLISLAPNVIPLLLVGGAMGFAGIVLKPSTALIFPLAFGIAVDDTIHFLAKYRMVLAAGVPRDEAVVVTLRETGKAILFTSLVLMGGFLVFTLSSFGGTVNLGALTALTLFAALVANLFLLPALLFRFGPASIGKSQSVESVES